MSTSTENISHSSTSTAAAAFRSDPRIEQAKQLLLDALRDHTNHISYPHAAEASKAAEYQALIDRLSVARGGATYFPYLGSGLGNGPLVELADGSVKLDFIGGIGVHGLGHSHPTMMLAAVDAALEDTIMQGNLQQHTASLLMCEKLLQLARRFGGAFDHCLLSTSGAMANENSLKIAFHNRPQADRLIALDNCFAGRTIATAQLTDRPQYRDGIPTALAVDYLPMINPHDIPGSAAAAAGVLHKILDRYPKKHAALWLELVAGEGGYYPGTSEFFKPLMELAKSRGVLVIADEVQTFGRLSQPFAFQHFQLDSLVDIVTIGKITQVCATLYPTTLKPKSPILSQTFTGASASIAAGLAMLDTLIDQGAFGANGSNLRLHQFFAGHLQRLAKQYPGRLSGPFGAGMMVAFTPDSGSEADAKKMLFDLYHAGLMGFLAGHDPSRIRFLPPPGATTEKDIILACEIIESVLSKPKTEG